jgi:hypothetical protein
MQSHLAPSDSRRSLSGAIDVWTAAASSLVVFLVYVRTVYPGVFGLGDAAKFSFVGKVLGTPHAPGYPLYVLVSHLFSYLPIGSLAYRMNILSAVLASVAVGFAYLAARVLGISRIAAVSTVLALGFGRAFWSKALYAKGYTLNAALVCAGVLMLLTWGRTRHIRHLYWAIAIFALSIGNHLVVISLVPALVLYVLWTDVRTALAPRTLLITAALVALGFSQYSLILVRTWQHAPYLEASASNIRELVAVLTARRYAHQIGAFSLKGVVETRIPVVAGLVRTEMTGVGLLLTGVGFVVLLRTRPREAVLCSLGALGVIALTANMSANEDEGFLLPAFVLLWLLAGTGFEWTLRAISRATSHVSPRLAAAITALTAIVLAAWLPVQELRANYKANDHSRRTFETRYFNALFEVLPPKAVIVLDRYPTNMMVLYKLLGEGAAAGRDIVTLPPDPAQVEDFRRRGYQIFAFAQGKSELGKFGYQFEPVQLYDVPLPQYFDVIRDQWTVAVAATADAVATMPPTPGAWRRLGGSGDPGASPTKTPYGLIGVAAARGRGIESAGRSGFDISVAAGSAIGSTNTAAPAALRVEGNAREAVVSVNGVVRGRTDHGAVLAIVDPAGGVESYVMETGRALRVPFALGVLPFFQVADAGECADVGNVGWREVTSVAAEGRVALRIDNYRSFTSRVVFYVAAAQPSEPGLAEVSGRGAPVMSVKSFKPSVPSERAALVGQAAKDGFESAAALATEPSVSRIEIAVNDEGDHRALTLDFGTAPVRVMVRATVDLDNARRATICRMSAER